jgi:homospermidine synthase
MKMPFSGRVLILGCGSVSRCVQPLLLRHFEMDFSKVTILDFADLRHTIADTLAAGVQYVQDRVRPDNLATVLSQFVGTGDLLIDLAWNIDTGEIIQWCHDHNVMYLNTSIEIWDPYEDAGSIPPIERTLYVRHMALRQRARSWSEPGPTAVVEHGANPGLVSHFAKVALEDIARAMLPSLTRGEQRGALEQAPLDVDGHAGDSHLRARHPD